MSSRRHRKINKITKSLRNQVLLGLMKILYKVPNFFSLSLSHRFGILIGNCSSYFPGRFRRQVLSNLRKGLGHEKSYSELRKLSKQIGIEVIKSSIELAYALHPKRKDLMSSIIIKGRDHLDYALSKKKGVIALSAHLGNFAIMGSKFADENYPFHMVLKLPKDPDTAIFLRKHIDRQNFKYILAKPTMASTKQIVRCLHNNEIVCLIADGDQKRGGIPVNFMGEDISIASGPAVLSHKTGAIILPIFIVRQPDDSHIIFIDPPVETMSTPLKNDRGRSLTIKLTRLIESYIRRYPAQWYWMNKKHKNRLFRKM